MRSLSFTHLTVAVLVATLSACASTPPVSDIDDGGFDDSSALAAVVPVAVDTSTVTAVKEPDAPVISAAQAALLQTTTIYFSFDKSTIQPESYSVLKAHASYIAGTPSARVRLEGHADERGTREYNIALGERRGMSVAKFMRINGVADSQIEVISYGEEKAAVYGSSESSYAKNRRVEIAY